MPFSSMLPNVLQRRNRNDDTNADDTNVDDTNVEENEEDTNAEERDPKRPRVINESENEQMDPVSNYSIISNAIENFELDAQAFFHGWRVDGWKEAGGYETVLARFGVRISHNTTKEQYWYCLASASCREEGKCIKLVSSTSNATWHLKTVHHVTSKKTQIQNAKLDKMNDRHLHLKKSQIYKTN